ncbi:MAG: tyrosine-type recombinase/integrase, partial [Terrimicrobiaceae bacterium]|nr:tyrosine-type recombinase/integrase [Terrimicrobiaceae bacterium]
MNTKNNRESSSVKDLLEDDKQQNPEQTGTGRRGKTAKQLPNKKQAGIGKNSANYWKSKIFKPVNSAGDTSPNYSMRLSYRGKRMAFTLETSNQEAAAAKAAGIYGDLLALGIEGALAKHRPTKGEDVSTLGEWIEAARKVFDKSPTTFDAYARAARNIAADILKVERTKKRFGRKGGSFRQQADKTPVSIFTARAVQEWKIRYVKERGANNPARQRAARISCNSGLRMARSLFQEDIAKHLPPLDMEERPFAKVDFYPRESMKYHSKIDPAILLGKARADLGEANPEAFKILLLALGAGLRRGEIDRLLWRQIDLDGGEIHIEVTEAGGLKSADSTAKVAIDETLCGLLRGFKAKADSQYLIEGGAGEGGSRAWGQRYRCQDAFDSLLAWLRKNGVEDKRALHTLRKEAGAIIATKSGIYAASRFLRHSDIKTTAQHYADNKERVSIDLGALMPAEGVIPFPSGQPEETK